MLRRVLAVLAPFALLAAPTFAQEPAPGNDRFVSSSGDAAPARPALAAFGPFRVLDPGRAALVDATDEASPRQFAQMLLAFPGLRTIEMVDCPGTSDDTANLKLGRMIRRAGLDTHVPPDGSVRSGAVELFLAGKHRTAAVGAEFAVHSWRDADGQEADDVADDDPVNLAYLAYYREMGLSEVQARAFYAMTNTAPHDGALWLTETEFASYAPLD